MEIGCSTKKKKDKTKQTQDESKQADIFESNKAEKPQAPVGMILTRATQVNKFETLQQKLTSILRLMTNQALRTTKLKFYSKFRAKVYETAYVHR